MLNEKPQNDLVAATSLAAKASALGKGAVIHTTMGDITLRLYPDECPKTVETIHMMYRDDCPYDECP